MGRKKSTKTMTCMLCSQDKIEHYFARHRNENMSELIGFCRDCLRTKVDIENHDSVIEMLRLMNVPFLYETWEATVSKYGDQAFSKYLQIIGTKKKYKGFRNSEFDVRVSAEQDFDITEELIKRWGKGLSEAEYYNCEKEYDSLRRIKEPATTLEERRYIQNVKLSRAVDRALASGEHQAISNLKKAYANDLKELGLEVDISTSEEVRTLGTRIKEWERTRPIPEVSEDLEDVDNIQEYMRKYFVIPMKRVFGQASQEELNELYE